MSAMRKVRTCLGIFSGLLLAAGGCSATSAAMETFRIGKNVAKKDSYLKIWVDGHPAEQNALKKAYFGHASFKVGETVSTRPTFKFDFIDPSKFGRITGTHLAIYQEFEGDYSHQAEFTINPVGTGTDNLMRPNIDYNLGAVPPTLQCMNFEKQTVPGVELKAGVDHLLVFTMTGDRSETVQILISTK